MKALPTKRGFWKYFFLSIITLGIYGLVVMYHISEEINMVARNDGKKTMNYILLAFLLTPITLGIADLVWYTRISNRIGDELDRRNLGYKFGAGSFWGWNIFGALLLGIGPCIYTHKLMKSMNLLNESYNRENGLQ